MLHLIRELIRLGKPGVLTVKVGGVLDRFDFGQCLTALRDGPFETARLESRAD